MSVKYVDMSERSIYRVWIRRFDKLNDYLNYLFQRILIFKFYLFE